MAFSLGRARGAVAVPSVARRAVSAVSRERLLTWARDEDGGATVVAGAHHLFVVSPDGDVALQRPWHLVDAGSWDHDAFSLTVTWVDGAPPDRWVLRERSLLPETLRERVQASVVIADTVSLGARRTARVVLRQNLQTGEIIGQTLLGRGVRASDPGVADTTAEALRGLREQVGLD